MLSLITFTVLPLHGREWTYQLTPKLARYHTRYWLQSPSHRNLRINPPSRFLHLDMMLLRNIWDFRNHRRNVVVNCYRCQPSHGRPLSFPFVPPTTQRGEGGTFWRGRHRHKLSTVGGGPPLKIQGRTWGHLVTLL